MGKETIEKMVSGNPEEAIESLIGHNDDEALTLLKIFFEGVWEACDVNQMQKVYKEVAKKARENLSCLD